MTATGADDRRDSKRANAQLSVRLGGSALDAGEVVARTLNVSPNGAYCVVSCEIPLFTRLDLCLEVPVGGDDGPPMRIACTGIVVRQEAVPTEDGGAEHSIAVFFERIAPRGRQAIEAFIDQNWASS